MLVDLTARPERQRQVGLSYEAHERGRAICTRTQEVCIQGRLFTSDTWPVHEQGTSAARLQITHRPPVTYARDMAHSFSSQVSAYSAKNPLSDYLLPLGELLRCTGPLIKPPTLAYADVAAQVARHDPTSPMKLAEEKRSHKQLEGPSAKRRAHGCAGTRQAQGAEVVKTSDEFMCCTVVIDPRDVADA